MSMELWVGLPQRGVANATSIAAAAQRLGLDLSVSDRFVLERAGGFESGRLDGEETGVEMHLIDPDEEPEVVELFGSGASTVDRLLAFYWGGDFLEGGFAFALAAVLVSDFGATCYDPEGGSLLSIDQIIDTARGMILEARRSEASGGARPVLS